MKLQIVPATRLVNLATDTSRPDRRLVHVHVFLVVEGTHARRMGHLHLVREFAAGEVGDHSWRCVDLAGVTRALDRRPGRDLPSDAVQSFEDWARHREVVLFRAPAANLVSEIGEDAETFRRRIATSLRPEIDAHLSRLSAHPKRRGSGAVGDRDARSNLAAGLATFAGGIEELRCGTLGDLAQRGTVGVLSVPETGDLPGKPLILVPEG
jgi:hypothetical protein